MFIEYMEGPYDEHKTPLIQSALILTNDACSHIVLFLKFNWLAYRKFRLLIGFSGVTEIVQSVLSAPQTAPSVWQIKSYSVYPETFTS